jgi:pimeloyl-ACP methyl ester carboxylesterase
MPALDIGGVRVGFLEQGTGEPVILLHSSASSGAQWRALAQKLSSRYRVLVPDLYGYGASGKWQGPAGAFGLAHEAQIVGALLQQAGGTAHLVGHSYGGALALHFGLRHAASILSLSLIEPTAFHLLRENEAMDAAAFAEIAAVAARISRACIDGDHIGGMASFVDYWSGRGTWAAFSTSKRLALSMRLEKVALDFQALFAEPTRLQDCWPLFMPTLLVEGSASPLPARRICGQLSRIISGSQLQVIEGAGHMLTLTHAERVNALVAAHLDGARGEPVLEIAA